MWLSKRNGHIEEEVKDQKWEILQKLKQGEWLQYQAASPTTRADSARFFAWNKLLAVRLAGLMVSIMLLIALALWLPSPTSDNGHKHKASPSPGKVATKNDTGGAQVGSHATSSPPKNPTSNGPEVSNANASSSLGANSNRGTSATSGNKDATSVVPGNGITLPSSTDSTSESSQVGLTLPTASAMIPAQTVAIDGQSLITTPSIGLQL